MSNNEVCSTTSDGYESSVNEVEIGQSTNREADVDYGRQARLYDVQMELQNFPEMEEINNGNESPLELNNNEEDNFLTQAIQNSTIVAKDITDIKNQISSVSSKSELIENELKIKNIQYKALEAKLYCCSLFLDSTLTEFETMPTGDYQKITDEDIDKLLSS